MVAIYLGPVDFFYLLEMGKKLDQIETVVSSVLGFILGLYTEPASGKFKEFNPQPSHFWQVSQRSYGV